MAGKRMTSRAVLAPVKIIASRSIPRPTPPVGGIPCSSASMKSSSRAGPPRRRAPARRPAARSGPLLDGVVELGVGVGDLESTDEGLQALDQALFAAVRLGEGRELDRVVEEEGGLDQLRLDRLGDSPSTSLPQPRPGSRLGAASPRPAPRGWGARRCRCRSARGSPRAASPAAMAGRGRSSRRRARPSSCPAPARRPRRPAARGRARSSRSRRRPRTTRAS